MGDGDDRVFLKKVASKVMEMQFDAEKLPLEERDAHIIAALKKIEAEGLLV